MSEFNQTQEIRAYKRYRAYNEMTAKNMSRDHKILQRTCSYFGIQKLIFQIRSALQYRRLLQLNIQRYDSMWLFSQAGRILSKLGFVLRSINTTHVDIFVESMPIDSRKSGSTISVMWIVQGKSCLAALIVHHISSTSFDSLIRLLMSRKQK